MKKSLRKLSLSRETLRTLETNYFDLVAGGGPKTFPLQTLTCPTNTDCDCTYSCPELCSIQTLA